MKKLSTLLIFAGIFSCNIAAAQKVDSIQTKKDSTKKADYFSKYKTKPASKNTQVNETWNQKQAEKKVSSEYKTNANGQVTGGKTTLKLGKKN